jgi:hypothetical protein
MLAVPFTSDIGASDRGPNRYFIGIFEKIIEGRDVNGWDERI